MRVSYMTGKAWFRIRLGLMAFAFVASIAVPPPKASQFGNMSSRMAWIAFLASVLLSILALPVMLQLVFALQAVNPHSDKVWSRPTHQSNPFHIGNPLLFFHFGAYVIGTGSLGILISAIWNGLPALLGGLAGIVGASSVMLGVRVGIRVFKSKLPYPS